MIFIEGCCFQTIGWLLTVVSLLVVVVLYSTVVVVASNSNYTAHRIRKQHNQRTIPTGDSHVRSIHNLRHRTNEKLFQWFNKETIEAGATTCGYLFPSLGYSDDDHNEAFPTIKVKFCMRLADEQPATKGNLVVHCGGPGSLSDCPLHYVLGSENRRQYNIITFDQRGMGMSWPSFVHEQCTYGTETNESGNSISVEGMNPRKLNVTNSSNIEQYLNLQRERIGTCWSCEECDFFLPAADGSNKTYHFLHYSGTREVAQDIDLFRQAIASTKLSLYGIGYGSQVMATYATLFPNHTDKFVIFGNMPPEQNLLHYASATAKNEHESIARMNYRYSLQNNTFPGRYPIPLDVCLELLSDGYQQVFSSIDSSHVEALFFDVFMEELFDTFRDACDAAYNKNEADFLSTLIQMEAHLRPEPYRSCMPGIFEVSLQLLHGIDILGDFVYQSTQKVSPASISSYVFTKHVDRHHCQHFVASSNDRIRQQAVVLRLISRRVQHFLQQQPDGLGGNNLFNHTLFTNCTGPTFVNQLESPYLMVSCIGNETRVINHIPYKVFTDAPVYLLQNLIFAQDMMMEGNLNDHQYVFHQVQKIYKKYGQTYYAQRAAAHFLTVYGFGHYWPKTRPVIPIGDHSITGIVGGQVYDYANPHKFTLDMKMVFPRTTLVTSEGTSHTIVASREGTILRSRDVETYYQIGCQMIINHYFATGKIQVDNGHVCASS